VSTTLVLQGATVGVVLVALVCGRYADKYRDASVGTLAVVAGIVGALLFVVLLYRGPR
jgi:hypothetical protein